MSIPTPTPDEPGPDDVARGLAELQNYLIDRTPVVPGAPAAEQRPSVVGRQATDQDDPEGTPTGESEDVPMVSERVRRLADEVAEAHALLALQGDQTPLLVDTDRVRRRRKAAVQARALHQLGSDPAARAWQAARWRLVLTVTAVVALLLALGWSTAGVQVFAAQGAPGGSAAWWFAWCVEPFMSLALLTVVAARAFMATRGQPLDAPVLRRVEGLFLTLTLGMNAWPHLPGIAHPFSVSRLVLHVLGPIVAVAIVTALPPIWRAFTELDHGQQHGTGGGGLPGPYSPYPAPTGRRYSGNTTATGTASGAATGAWVARARALIAAGQLPVDPSATRLRTVLGCGTDTARQVRDVLKGHGGGGG
ncbi:MAG TPA: conjugal transfer protein TraI [Pseudonocardiaceae bacterium]|nr:conjugal transfer protein TraI [Pseudonocardiaceae bacterium]